MQKARNHTEPTRFQKLTVAHIAKKCPTSSKPKCSLNVLTASSVLPLFLHGAVTTGEPDRASTVVHCTKSQVIYGHCVPTAGFLGKYSYVLFCFLDRAFSIMKTKINQQNAQINSGLIYY